MGRHAARGANARRRRRRPARRSRCCASGPAPCSPCASAGTLVDRWGAPALPAALAAFGGAAALPGLATSTAGLCAALLVLGATSGAVDVAINAEGVRSEAATGRPVLSLAHGTFSACVVAGSLAAGGLRAAGAGPETVLVLVGLAVVATAAVLVRAPAAGGARPAARASLRPVPRLLIVLGALCALAFFVENAWQSWGAVHLESDLDASPALGALAPALFAGAAALSRLGSHAFAGRVSELALLRGGATLGAAGTLLGALAPVAGLSLVGIVVAGAGISICAPVLFSIAGRGADEAVRGAGDVDRDDDRLPRLPGRARGGGPARERDDARRESGRRGRRRPGAGDPRAREPPTRGLVSNCRPGVGPRPRRPVVRTSRSCE